MAVDAVRIPGLNDHACQSGVITATGTLAKRLASDVNGLQDVPRNVALSCPADDGHGIDLVFRYQGPNEALVIQVAFAGCAFVSGLSRAKSHDDALVADLHAFVPSSWFAWVT